MPTVVNRITVSITIKAEFALRRLENRLGMSKTDLVNRALQLYDFVEEERGKGKSLAYIDKDGIVERVTFI